MQCIHKKVYEYIHVWCAYMCMCKYEITHKVITNDLQIKFIISFRTESLKMKEILIFSDTWLSKAVDLVDQDNERIIGGKVRRIWQFHVNVRKNSDHPLIENSIKQHTAVSYFSMNNHRY